jgi:cathepsin D
VQNLETKFLGGENIRHHHELHNYEDWSYYVEVSIGTPAQTFMLAPDTISSDSWVYSKNCWSLPCFYQDLYDNTKSSTYVKQDANFTIHLADHIGGAGVGIVSEDIFTMGNFTANDFKFGEVTTIHGNDFVFNKVDGYLGLGYNLKNYS